MADQDALERLSAAYRTEVNEGTKERHITEMSTAIRTAPPVPVPTGFALRRRIAGAAAAVAVVVAPVGMAVAAEDAVPGEFLYPLKQVTERVRAFIDDDIAATHRVEEAEHLVIRGAPIVEITRAVERAEAATSGLMEDRLLRPRLESVRERLRQQDELDSGAREREESPQSGRQDTPDGDPGNVGPSGGQNTPGEGSATTSVPGSQGPGDGEGARLQDGNGGNNQSAPPPPHGNSDTGAPEGGSGTPEPDGSGEGGTASPPTTARQNTEGASGS